MLTCLKNHRILPLRLVPGMDGPLFRNTVGASQVVCSMPATVGVPSRGGALRPRLRTCSREPLSITAAHVCDIWKDVLVVCPGTGWRASVYPVV